MVGGVGGDVCAAGQQASSLSEVGGEALLQGGCQCLVGFAVGGSLAAGLLHAQDEVDAGVCLQSDESALHSLVAARGERVSARSLDGLAVDEGVVEGVAGQLHALQFVAAVAQSALGLLSDVAAVKSRLLSTERGAVQVGYARVGPKVEALLHGVLYGGRPAQAVKGIDDEHRPPAVGRLIGGQGLAGETLASGIHGRDAEAIDQSLLQWDLPVGFVHIGAVVEAAVADACIDHVARGVCRRFQRVFHGLPAQSGSGGGAVLFLPLAGVSRLV